MYVCICKAVTEKTIRDHFSKAGTTEAFILSGVGHQCGKCVPRVKEILEEMRKKND